MPERRKHPRAYIPLTATVYNDTGKLGDYLVENLSAGGALLVNGPPILPGMEVRAVFRGARVKHLTIDAQTLRLEASQSSEAAVAIKFGQIAHPLEDFVHRVVLNALEHAEDPAVLLVHRNPVLLTMVARKLVGLGRRPILAMTRFGAVRTLSDLTSKVEAVVVDVTEKSLHSGEILDFVAKRFPAVRRIGLFERGRGGWLISDPSLRVDAVLRATSTLSEMRKALGLQSRLNAHVPRDSFSNSVPP